MNPRTAPTGLFRQLVATLLATMLLVVGFLFSVVLVPVVAALGVIGLGYAWWKTRAIRRVIRERMAASNRDQGAVIEGEATIIREAPGAGNDRLILGEKVR